MLQIIKKMNVLLDKKQKRTMVGLIILMVISAFLQTAGVGMLVEVMQIVIDPEAVQHSRVAEACYEILGVQSYRTFSIIVMVLLILVFVVKNLFTYFQQKLTLSFVYTNQFRTSERMMRNYLRRGYEFYLNADTAVVQRSITSDVNNMYALILALLQLLSDTVVSLFVISYCFISSGTMTILMAVVLLSLMWLIKRVLKPVLVLGSLTDTLIDGNLNESRNLHHSSIRELLHESRNNLLLVHGLELRYISSRNYLLCCFVLSFLCHNYLISSPDFLE